MPEEAKEVKKVGFSEDLGLELNFVGSEESGSDELLGASPVTNTEVQSEDDKMFTDPLTEIVEEPTSKTEKSIEEQFEELINSDTKETNQDTPATVDDKSKVVDKKPANQEQQEGKNKDTSGSLTVAFAKILQERGYSDFNEEEYIKAIEEKGEAEAYIDLMDKINTGKEESLKSTLDEFSQEYIKFRESGFTVEEAKTMVGNVETIATITDEQVKGDEKLAENIVREVERLKGTTQEEIDENIQLLKDTDKLLSRGVQNKVHLLNYHKNLADRQFKDKQDAAKNQEAANKTYIEELKADINATDEIIKDRKINQQTKDKIYDLIMKPVKKEDGTFTNAIWSKRDEDPKAFDKKLAYFITSGLFDGNTKSLARDARTKAMKSIKDTLEKGRSFTAGEPSINQEKSSLNAMGSKIDEMKDFLDD